MELGEFQQKRRERRERDAHLLAHRDDRREWSIYADWLEREGDPRGALVSLMLAREANPTPQLAAAERELLAARPPWLFPSRALAGTWHSWWRGFLREVDMLARSNPATDLAQLAQHPSAQLLQYLALAPSSASRKETLAHAAMLPVRSLRIADSADDSGDAAPPIDLGPLLASPHLTHLVLACTFDFSPTDWTRAGALTELTLTHATGRVVEQLFSAPPPGLIELRLVKPLEPDSIVDAFVTSRAWSKLKLLALHECALGPGAARRLTASARPARVVVQPERATEWDPAALGALATARGVVTTQLERQEQAFLVLDSPGQPVALSNRVGRSAALQLAGRPLWVCLLHSGEDPAALVESAAAPRAAAFEFSASRRECRASHFAGGARVERRVETENLWSLVQSELDALFGFDPGAGVYPRLMQALVEAMPG